MRLLRKIFGNRKKYCEEFGHNSKKIKCRIERRNDFSKGEYSGVLVRVDAELYKCNHCGFVASILEVEDTKEIYHSATLPDSYWREIREKGYRIYDSN